MYSKKLNMLHRSNNTQPVQQEADDQSKFATRSFSPANTSSDSNDVHLCLICNKWTLNCDLYNPFQNHFNGYFSVEGKISL